MAIVEIRSGNALATLEGRFGDWVYAAWSPDGTRLVTSTVNGSAGRIRDEATGEINAHEGLLPVARGLGAAARGLVLRRLVT